MTSLLLLLLYLYNLKLFAILYSFVWFIIKVLLLFCICTDCNWPLAVELLLLLLLPSLLLPLLPLSHDLLMTAFSCCQWLTSRRTGALLTILSLKSMIFWDTLHNHRCENLKSSILSLIPVKQMLSRLCNLVIRVSGCRSRGPGFDSRRSQIFWEATALERGQLSLVRTTEELLGIKSSSSGLEYRD
jgi:hypothetical protein